MKKLLFLAMLFSSVTAHATTCTIPYGNVVTGGFIFAAQWNANVSAIENCLNNQTLDGTTNIAIGGIGTSNIANLAVTDAKIFGITTAGKVNGSAITQINNVPLGAGALPEINVAKLDSSGNGIDGGAIISGLANVPSGAGLIPPANVGGLFGTWQTPSCSTGGTAHQATTDGILTAYASASQGVNCYTDGNSTPTTLRTSNYPPAGEQGGCTTPVRKNDYYMVTTSSGTCTSYFLPLGS